MLRTRAEQYADAHQRRGDDPWRLVASLYGRIHRLESDPFARCAWTDWVDNPPGRDPVQCQASPVDQMLSTAGSEPTAAPYVRGLVFSHRDGAEPRLPLCEEHLEQFIAAVELIVTRTYTARHEEAGVVYYLRRENGDIKIGTSKKFRDRLNSLRLMHGDLEVLAVEEGSYSLESRMHRKFRNDRILGTEWFAPSEALLAHIRTVESVPWVDIPFIPLDA